MTIHEVVKADVRCAVLDLIQQEREGGTVEHGLLKRIVEVSSTSTKVCRNSAQHRVLLIDIRRNGHGQARSLPEGF